MSKILKFDICVCGYSFKDTIYELNSFPKENSNKSYDAFVSNKFGGVFNTLRALRFLNKKIKIKVLTILGKDEDGKQGLKEIKKLNINHNSIVFNNSTSTSLNIINKKKNTKTFIVRFNSKKIHNISNVEDSKWVHFMYLDNIEFINQFKKIVLNKKKGQFFSADLSRRTISKLDLSKYLNKLDFLICSTKELPSLFKSNRCNEFNQYSMQKIKTLSKKIKYIVVHNKFKSLGFIDGTLIEVKNNNLVNNQNINITGAGDTFTASLINDFITNNKIDNKSISDAHKIASKFCMGKIKI